VLRTNLSTRPFYNERAVHAAIGAAALVVVALTAVTVTRVVQLSRENTELSARISRDQTEADRLTREATAIRRGLNKDELESVAAAAREANELIDQRTFSWTAFFNHIESTLPPEVMLTSVQPSVKDGVTRISMAVLARRTDDIDEFVEKLEASGAFENVLNAREDRTPEGLERALLQSLYTGHHAENAAAPAQPATDQHGSTRIETEKAPAAAPPAAKPQTAPPAGGRGR
jgi:Tfp pilus assembly protein PilN